MMPMAVPNSWPHEESQYQGDMAAPYHHEQQHYPYQPYPHPSKQQLQTPPYLAPEGRPRQPYIAPRAAPSLPHPGPFGPPQAGLAPSNLSGPPTPTTPTTPSSATSDVPFRPLPNGNARPPPFRNIHPPLDPSYAPVVPPSSTRWDSLQSASNGGPVSPIPPVGPNAGSPTSPRLPPYGAAPPAAPRARSRPTTPAHNDAAAFPDSHSEPPSRPLTSKSSMSDMRSPPHDPSGIGIGNFSRPRKQSIRQPVSEAPGRSRPAFLPAPSEEPPPPMWNGGQPSPWQRPRHPSASSNASSYTWGAGFSPTSSEFPDMRSGPPRVRNVGPPPVSTNRGHFGYNTSRIDSSGSAPAMGGAAAPPWASGDELRSSFRSQLTTSSAPGTERSSVLTKDSSTTSFDANHDTHGDAEEPSLEDVMGMYEKGFDDDHRGDDYFYDYNGDSFTDSNGTGAVADGGRDAINYTSNNDETELYSRPASSASERSPSSNNAPAVDANIMPPPPPQAPASRLDAEIRQSKLIFTSAAFMASVPHLASAMQDADDEGAEKRDSGKSTVSDASDDKSRSTISNPQYGTTNAIHSARPSAAETIKRDTLSPTPTDSIQGDMADSSPPESATSSASKYPQPSPPPQFSGPMEPEEPGSRDRYGFKKESQYVSRKQYDNWDRGYSEYLARRKKKWTAFLKENSLMTDSPNRFPSPGPKTKKFVRKGIPPEWRGAAWFYYAGGPAILAKHGGLYAKLLHKKAKRVDVEAIERDLHRTFPDNINFRPPGSPVVNTSDHNIIDASDTVQPKPEEPPIISALRRVLFAFSIYNQNIGYCQSLNFIAGMLLLFVDTEEQCFWLLNVITHIYLPGTHELSLEGSKVDLGVLMAEIRDTLPAVWDRIGGELESQPSSRPSTSRSIRRPKFRRRTDQNILSTERLPPITMCMTAWFMSCFIGTLPIETTLRVWDVFFYEGSKTLFRVALAIFKSGESEILSVSDPMEMFGVVQSMPRKMVDANGLIDTCFKRRNGFGHLSQGAIDERRQERRDKTQQGEGGAGNDVTEGSGEVRRKGTLFRRKKRDPSRQRSGEA